MIGQFVLALAILVTLHELGHYTAARIFGIKVEKFYLFFDAWGFKLFKFKKGDTEYGIGWLPLGGYVKIAGMIDESMDTEQMKKPAEPWEFRSKPAWQRLIVMLGGIIVNVILGLVIYIGCMWYYGETKMPVDKLKYGIYAENGAKDIGLKTGDKITGVNGEKIPYFEDARNMSIFLKDNNYYNVDRNGEKLEIPLPKDIINRLSNKKMGFFDEAMISIVDSILPNSAAQKGGLKKGDQIISLNDTPVLYHQDLMMRTIHYANKKVEVKVLRNQNDTQLLTFTLDKDAKFGFGAGDVYENERVHLNYGFGESVSLGTHKSVEAIKNNYYSIKGLVSGKIKATNMSGTLRIATFYGGEWHWRRFWMLTGILSLGLAFMNLLPIPALDGGHVLFLLVEMIIRRPLSDKFMQVMQVVGFVIVLSLIVFTFGNDIYNLFIKK